MSKIGSYLEGGFYMGDHLGNKLILSPKKYEVKLPFGGYRNISSAYSKNSGKGNTLDLVLKGDRPAAEYCYNLDIDGYNDWYLPAINELKILYQNKDKVPENETFDNCWYWSSTEHSSSFAWIRYFLGDIEFNASKSIIYSVRAIRRIAG